jgi:hypothetical protein
MSGIRGIPMPEDAGSVSKLTELLKPKNVQCSHYVFKDLTMEQFWPRSGHSNHNHNAIEDSEEFYLQRNLIDRNFARMS